MGDTPIRDHELDDRRAGMGTEPVTSAGEAGATLHAVSSAVLAVTRHLSVHEVLFLANKRSLANKCSLADKQRGGGRSNGFSAADEELLTLFAAHAAIAITNARLYDHNRELTVVAERNRLARELHDAVAQKLFSLRLTARAAMALAERDPAQAARELEQVERLAAEALAELRAVIFELRPADLADGLVASLRKHCEVLDRAYEAEVLFSADSAVTLAEEQEGVLFRIAQEALHNALRHASARTVEVRLCVPDGRVVLEVGDDGAGFDPASTAAQGGSGTDGAEQQQGGGLGLASMRDRAESVGAAFTIDASLGKGTVVRLEVPL